MKNISKEASMQSIEDASKCSKEARKILQTQRLKDLVAYAKINSDYFSELYVNSDMPIVLSKNRKIKAVTTEMN